MNEADKDIGDNLGRSSLEIGPIGLIGPIATVLTHIHTQQKLRIRLCLAHATDE